MHRVSMPISDTVVRVQAPARSNAMLLPGRRAKSTGWAAAVSDALSDMSWRPQRG